MIEKNLNSLNRLLVLIEIWTLRTLLGKMQKELRNCYCELKEGEPLLGSGRNCAVVSCGYAEG